MTAARREPWSVSEEVRRRLEGEVVWVVFWELPDKSWESLCSSASMAKEELSRREGDNLISKWGMVKQRGPIPILDWLVGNCTSADESECQRYIDAALDVVEGRKAGSNVPVTLRTW